MPGGTAARRRFLKGLALAGAGPAVYGAFLQTLSWLFSGIAQSRLWLSQHRIFHDQPLGTGDAARRLGNEYLFQTLAKQNVETLGRRLADEQGDRMVVLAGNAIRGVAMGVVVTAVLQSALGTRFVARLGPLSPLGGSLLAVALFAAEVSTADAVLFMLATSLSRDLFQAVLRPTATDAQLRTTAMQFADELLNTMLVDNANAACYTWPAAGACD